MASNSKQNMSTASITSLNADKPFLTTSFPTTLPTPSGLSPTAEDGPGSKDIDGFPLPPQKRGIKGLFARADDTAARLSKILSTPSGIDTTLSTLCYTLKLVAASSNTLLATQLKGIANSVLNNAADVLLPGETVVASFPAPRVATALAQTVASSKALADLISDYRAFARLWGLLGIYAWGKGVYHYPPADGTLATIARAQVAVNLGYQFTENRAYLASHGIIRRSEGQVGRDWIMSSRFWLAHILLDFVRLYRVRAMWDEDADAGTGVVAKRDEGFDIVEARRKRRKEVELWWKGVTANICYAPMALHYSLPGGYLSEPWLGLLGMLAGGAGFRVLWRQSKE